MGNGAKKCFSPNSWAAIERGGECVTGLLAPSNISEIRMGHKKFLDKKPISHLLLKNSGSKACEHFIWEVGCNIQIYVLSSQDWSSVSLAVCTL